MNLIAGLILLEFVALLMDGLLSWACDLGEPI